MRCLIIDDDESPRILMERIISRGGHTVRTADSCASAQLAMDELGFDVALVDMEMPGQDGAETIAQLRARNPMIRILVVSGYDDKKHVMRALEAGADGYLLKDEIRESLPMSLHDVRAGNTPLSPRVAAIMLRQLRKTFRDGEAPGKLARIRPIR